MLPDSPIEIPDACPLCEPDRDPRTYSVFYCSDAHRPDLHGSADEIASPIVGIGFPSGNGEAGDENNRAFCAFFHRDREKAVQDYLKR